MTEASSTEDVITLRIRFKSETLERFIERYGGDLGPDEVFVRTKEPLAVGTAIAFDFTLNDGTPLINGRGRVAWVRLLGDPVGGPGMGVRIQSLSAASWQTLRKVLAGTGRSDAGVGASLLGRRSTPSGPPSVGAASGPTAASAPAEDAERTEVARMPPSFCEQAFETGPRAQERPRPQPRQPTASFDAAATPAVGRPLNEPLSGTGGGYERLDLDDIDEDVTVSSADPSFGRRSPPMAPERPERSMNFMPEPWPRSLTPAASRTRAASDEAGMGRAVSGSEGAASWRSTSPRGGLEATAPAGNPALGVTAPMGQPALSQLVSSTSPTLPATHAVLYDPDNVEPTSRAPEPMGAMPRPVPPSAFPPVDSGGGINEFDNAPRSGSGRIPPAISPEEMALAASAVRGPAGETPLWPGVTEEPPRTSTFKIWAALFLAASGVVGALLWLTPLLTKRASVPAQPVGAVEGPAAATPPESVPPSEPSAPAVARAEDPAAAPTPTPPPPAAAPTQAAPPAAGAGAANPETVAAAPRPRPRIRRPRRVAESGESESPFADPAAAPAARPETPALGAAAPATGTSPAAPAPVPAAPAAGTEAPAAAGPPAAEPGAEDVYWLSVRSTPTGADVLIDGQVEGKTPFQRRIFDPGRSYALTVRKAGFTAVERTVSGSSEWAKRGNVRTLAVTARLEPASGSSPAEPGVSSTAPTTPPPASPSPPPAAPPPSGARANPFDDPAAPAPRP
ncbi:MAG TPA: PEGA domain-containing protein [Polyangia bacterium]